MSAALPLNRVPGADKLLNGWPETEELEQKRPAARRTTLAEDAEESEPPISLAFYRKHTERMLRRYLYASMQVGRARSVLSDPVGRGWVSSRPVRTFEDAVIFVLDVEKCLKRLGALERAMLSRIVLQEYTQAEAATLLGMSARAISYKFPLALDRLTEQLTKYGLLVFPRF
jgi:DNA-directed RNA polymerase specialized sigma24 family protein